MTTIADVEKALQYYHAHFRNPTLPALTISEPYDLFPPTTNPPAKNAWPNPFPFSGSPGVYLILDVNLSLLYVGKASMSNALGKRVGEYFAYDDQKGCSKAPLNGWKHQHYYVVTIPVPKDSAFEAPSIEEFLIQSLKPVENIKGHNKA